MKTLSILFLALLAPLSMNADTQKPQKQLAGIWQQIQKSNKEDRIMRLPVWKVMQNDLSFCTFLIANQDGQSIITNKGTYKMTSDSTYVEHINGSITDPKLVGRDNVITYEFKGDDTLHISYQMPGASKRGHETWVRVKLEYPE